MREFKFRAWDKFNKIMIYSDKNYPLSEYKIEFDWTDENKLSLMKLIDARYGEFRTFDAVIMQYTGLKDKNGKEIYEGDIVDIGNGERFAVGWHKYNQEFTFLNVNNNYFEKTYRGVSRDTWKVIGNIYQNKDLLK